MKINPDYIGYIFTRIIVFILGALFFFPSTYKIIGYCVTRNRSYAVYGEVMRQGCGAYIGCKPYVTYKDRSGNIHEIKSKVNFYWFFAPKRGDSLKVLIFQKDPSIAIVDSLLHYTAIPIVFSVIGAFLLISAFSGRITYAGS